MQSVLGIFVILAVASAAGRETALQRAARAQSEHENANDKLECLLKRHNHTNVVLLLAGRLLLLPPRVPHDKHERRVLHEHERDCRILGE